MNDRDTAAPRACGALGATLLLALALTAPVHAFEVQFRATDLIDNTSSQDLWRYDYRVSDGTFLLGQGFYVEFDYNTTSNLQDPPPAVNGDWDPQVAQPSQIIPDTGLYDALARADNPSLANLFSVEFVWSGGATGPGSQPFTVYDAAFAPIETGNTVAATPIPAPAALIAIGLLALSVPGAARRVRRAHHRARRDPDRRGINPNR